MRGNAWPPQQQNSAERLKEQRDELERICLERADLQRRMRDLQSTVHDLSEERTNIARQADATARVVRGLDKQLGTLAGEENSATANLIRAQDELAIKRAVLRNRVRECRTRCVVRRPRRCSRRSRSASSWRATSISISWRSATARSSAASRRSGSRSATSGKRW